MRMKLQSHKPFPISLAIGDATLNLIGSPPSAGDRIMDKGFGLQVVSSEGPRMPVAFLERFNHRIVSTVLDWRGVVDENNEEVPFSIDGLMQILTQQPESLSRLADELATIFSDTWRHPESSIEETTGELVNRQNVEVPTESPQPESRAAALSL